MIKWFVNKQYNDLLKRHMNIIQLVFYGTWSGPGPKRWTLQSSEPASPVFCFASLLLPRFNQQSKQNILEERNTVLSALGRALSEAGSNDDQITEQELTKALSGLMKDTGHGPENANHNRKGDGEDRGRAACSWPGPQVYPSGQQGHRTGTFICKTPTRFILNVCE